MKRCVARCNQTPSKNNPFTLPRKRGRNSSRFLDAGDNRGAVPRLHERIYCCVYASSTDQRMLQTISAKPKLLDLMNQPTQVPWHLPASRVDV